MANVVNIIPAKRQLFSIVIMSISWCEQLAQSTAVPNTEAPAWLEL